MLITILFLIFAIYRTGGKPGSCQPCHACKGYGIKVTFKELGPGLMQQFQGLCQVCKGEKEIFTTKDRCKACLGRKVLKQTKNLEVPIDKGMRDGQKIFFRGEGDQKPGVEAGDVIVVLALQSHPTFELNGINLFMVHKLTLTEALCGFALPLKHLDGREMIVRKKPEEVIVPNSIKRIKGEGMPVYRNPFEKGDLYIQFQVEFPEPYFTSEAKLKELEKIFPFRGPPLKFDPNDEMVEEVGLHDFVPSEKLNGSATNGEAYETEDSNSQCIIH